MVVDTTSSRRTRNLLAFLLAHAGAPVPRDVLIEAFWPEADPDAGRNRLHVALSGARRALEAAWSGPVIERVFDAYRITGSLSVWTDVQQFESACRAGRRAQRSGDQATAAHHYESACQLYEGDFLSEEPYADWAAPIRDELRLQAVDSLGRLMQIYMGRAEYGPATLLGRRILRIDPCNEEVHRELMECYAASGQRHLALAQYRRLARLLAQTFGVRPSPATLALYERLRRPETPASAPAPVGLPRRPQGWWTE